jgi:hypothetical protein
MMFVQFLSTVRSKNPRNLQIALSETTVDGRIIIIILATQKWGAVP